MQAGIADWHPSTTGLGASELAEVKKAVKKIREDQPIGLAMVSGSLAMGVGHTMSDLDFYLASTDDSLLPRGGFKVAGRSVHINSVTKERLHRIASYADRFRVTSTDRSQLSLGPDDNKLLLRIVNSTVLYADAEFGVLLKAIDKNVVRQMVLLRHACHAVELQEDVYGALQSGDVMTALTASHRALLHALEAGLSGVGEIYDHEKVALRRLGRHPGTKHLLVDTWELINSGIPFGSSIDVVSDVCQRRMLLTSYLVGYASLLGWTSPAAEIPHFVIKDDGPRRSADFGLLRFANGIALTGREYGSRVSESMARLWLSLDGSPLEQALHSPLLKDRRTDSSAVNGAIRRLAEIGAVEM